MSFPLVPYSESAPLPPVRFTPCWLSSELLLCSLDDEFPSPELLLLDDELSLDLASLELELLLLDDELSLG